MGEDGEGRGIPKVVGSGRKRGKLCNVAKYFAIEKNAKRWEPTNTGQELGLKGTGRGRFKPLCRPHLKCFKSHTTVVARGNDK